MIGTCGRSRRAALPVRGHKPENDIAATGKRGRANADRDARLVHHLKHDGETLPLADQNQRRRFSEGSKQLVVPRYPIL